MILVKKRSDLQQILHGQRQNGQTIGFVPTMGALHNGHLSLIEQSKENYNLTVCSIFVNPTQFNNKADFDKYPVTIEKDINLLEQDGCDVLFLPSVDEMYPAGEQVIHYDLGFIETVLEGKYRPGHFQGVCQIVDKLLNAVKPDGLLLGQKDYQQCMVINKMIELRGHATQLIICPTIRQADGLAMSSRNMRLSDTSKQQALHIIQCLKKIKHNLHPGDIGELKQAAIQHLEQNGFKVDYVEVCDALTLQAVNTWDGKQNLVALAAAFLGDVRLIDNLLLTPTENTN